jgi:hypothetical protein
LTNTADEVADMRPYTRIAVVLLLLLALGVGAVSATTTTIYSGNASGYQFVYAGGAVRNVTWDTLMGMDTPGGQINTSASWVRMYSDKATDTYWAFDRAVVMFDGSTIPDNATITSAKIGLFRYSSKSNLGPVGIGITRFNINGTISIDDVFSNDLLSEYIATDSLATAKYHNWSLNPLGIKNISKTGPTAFGVRLQNDIEKTKPGWASITFSGFH